MNTGNINSLQTCAKQSKELVISPTEDRFIREAECKSMTGLSRTRRWELEQINQFPRRIKLGARAVAWKLSDIVSWMEARSNV